MECKERLRNELINSAMDIMDEESIDLFRDRMVMLLDKYDVSDRETSLAVVNEDKNRKWLIAFLTAKAAQGCTKRTLQFYGAAIPKVLERIGKTADEIVPDDVRMYVVVRTRKDGVSLTTAGNEYRVLSSFFDFLTKEELIYHNPFYKLKHPKKIKKQKKAFSEMDIEKIRGACKTERETAMIEVLLSTWCRLTEVVNIKISDIEDDRVTVLGKGNKERTVFLNAKARFALEKYLAQRKDSNPYVFPAMKGAHQGLHIGKKGTCKKYWYKIPRLVDDEIGMSKDSFGTIIKRLGKEAGVENTHPHRFRRTGATRALEKGMPIMTVSKILGHESVGTTQIYLDVSESSIHAEHRKFVI